MANDPATEAAHDGDATAVRAGEQLRAARERRRLSQAQAAAEMRIDLTTLKALEADDFSRLGAPIFVKGHLRNYAKQLGIAVEPLLEAYERAAQPAPPPLVGYRNEGEQMEGRVEFKRMLLPVAAGVASVLLFLFALWIYQRPAPAPTPAPAGSAADSAAAAPASQAATIPAAPSTAPAAVPTPPQGGAGAAPAPAAAATPGVVARTDAAHVEPPRVEPARSEPAVAEPKPAAAATAQVRVALRFSGESWVEVYDAANQPLVYQLFDAGQSREVAATPPLRVFIGQAAAVGVTIDGKRIDVAALTKRDATARFTIGAGGAVR